MAEIPDKYAEIKDLEIVESVVRLARSGRFTKGKALLNEVIKLYPEKEKADLVRACNDAANLLIDQHKIN